MLSALIPFGGKALYIEFKVWNRSGESRGKGTFGFSLKIICALSFVIMSQKTDGG